MKSTFSVSTSSRDQMVDITGEVRRAISKSGVGDGICVVYCPHTTAGITINENADPDVPRDILAALDRAVPWKAGYRHAEGNSAAHVKSSLVGSSVTILVSDGQPVLGTWQSVFFCEFDGPRRRTFHVKVVAG
ncbi:MAG: YjbQ family protein [Deltaproteobacteria bacterium]|nr:MAG: YjbQ family protein [Deltaproteobacteria bacterium]